jgi:hypothetical protein
MLGGGGASVAGMDTKLGFGSPFFPVLLLFSAFFVSFPFAPAETRDAFKLVRAKGGSSISPARSDSSRLPTNPSSKEENALSSPAGAGPDGIAKEPTLLDVGEEAETRETVATFTTWLTQLEHQPD